MAEANPGQLSVSVGEATTTVAIDDSRLRVMALKDGVTYSESGR